MTLLVIVALYYLLRDSIQRSVTEYKQKDEMTSSIRAAQAEMAELKKVSFSYLPSYDGRTFDNGKGTVSVSPYTNGRYVVVVKDGVELMDIRSSDQYE